LIALLTTIWGCARLLITFIKHTNIASNSSNMFDTVGIIFLLLFLFTQAKQLAGMESIKNTKRLIVFGMSAMILICVFNIPQLVWDVQNHSEMSFFEFLPHFIDIMLMFYIFVFLLERTFSMKTQTATIVSEPTKTVEATARVLNYPDSLTPIRVQNSPANPKTSSSMEHIDQLINDIRRDEETLRNLDQKPLDFDEKNPRD
jgi:hypothetical protein